MPVASAPARIVEPTDVLWRRVGAFVIDEVVALAIGLAINALMPDDLARNARLLSFVVAWLSVFVVAQGLTGATPGKLLAGVRVVDEHGRAPGMGRALVRSLAWVVDGFPYVVPFVGFVAATADGHGQRLGDRWAGTYVVTADLAGHSPFPTLHRADGSAPQLIRTTDAVTTPALPSAGAALAAAPLEPTYDRERGTYVKWDVDEARLVEFVESEREWRPVP